MDKKELEMAVLHSDLEDIVKLEVIRCIETAKEKKIGDWNSSPYIRGKELNNDKLEITYANSNRNKEIKNFFKC